MSKKAKQICEKALLRAAYYADVLHVKEDPPGSNRGEYVEMFQHFAGVAPGYAWCASFAMEVLHECGWPTELMPTSSDWARGTVCSILQFAKDNHWPITADLNKVVRGALFLYCNKRTWHGHIGFVCETNVSREMFRTLEGNSRNMVDRRWRSMGDHNYMFINLPLLEM